MIWQYDTGDRAPPTLPDEKGVLQVAAKSSKVALDHFVIGDNTRYGAALALQHCLSGVWLEWPIPYGQLKTLFIAIDIQFRERGPKNSEPRAFSPRASESYLSVFLFSTRFKSARARPVLTGDILKYREHITERLLVGWKHRCIKKSAFSSGLYLAVSLIISNRLKLSVTTWAASLWFESEWDANLCVRSVIQARRACNEKI